MPTNSFGRVLTLTIFGECHESGQSVYSIHADHLGAPRAVVDASGSKRWEWSFRRNPFGEMAPNEDPKKTGEAFEFNLRFPGQYYDAESGLHYNYFRDYEPQTGRYVQSDPIGLSGGFSTYGYAFQSPSKYIDPLGLTSWICRRALDEPPGTKGFLDYSHTFLCATTPDGSIECGGQTTTGGGWNQGRPTTSDEDYYHPDSCTEIDDNENDCMEQCFLGKFEQERPYYGLIGPGTNCHEWARRTVWSCVFHCIGRGQ
ncbi:RHS repeat domain-containing protein [Wenzhouxiangella sediminis]|uniref:RHS repeat-associated core domain-containing protein n=1 Tax=Wenzhouxiangella sediminis TaxID=1792836 RepID=A0A3E1KAE5_9GAMM|nr:RHS repeat-associated core domain-containing protein [Wenzhouxiangella sediminis]RFF31158.1 hypothetical protein DZC52_04870 [Wenzhouxiangella sediminis]